MRVFVCAFFHLCLFVCLFVFVGHVCLILSVICWLVIFVSGLLTFYVGVFLCGLFSLQCFGFRLSSSSHSPVCTVFLQCLWMSGKTEEGVACTKDINGGGSFHQRDQWRGQLSPKGSMEGVAFNKGINGRGSFHQRAQLRG